MDINGCSLKEVDEDHNNFNNNYGLGSVFFKSMKKYNNKILQYIADTGETDTYSQVLIRSIRTALMLKEKGITKYDIISSCTHNHKNSIIPLIASLFLGIKTAHFDPNLSHLDTIHLLKLIKPKIIFVSLESLPFIEKCLKESKVDTELVVFGDTLKYTNFSEYLEPNPDENKFEPVTINDPKETIIIMFSSGTTGLPKGICLSHNGLLKPLLKNDLRWLSNTESITLLYTTLYWISAVALLIDCVIRGSARVVCSKFDAANTWKLIENYKITSIFMAPHFARDILATPHKDADTSSLKYFLIGGDPVTEELMEGLKEALPYTKVIQGYGQTEASGMIMIFNPNDSKQMELQNRKPSSCGKILSSYTWKIVDPITEEILGPNQRGEFRYKNDYHMNGYYNIDSSSAYDTEGFLKSGDIVYYDEEGCFFIVDRIKEMFKYKGWHILPALLEGVLSTHPAVRDAAVIGIPNEADGHHPMGIVVLNKGYEDVTSEDIVSYVGDIVTDSQRLRAGVKIVEGITRTTTGKIRRSVMKNMVLEGKI